MKKKTLAIVLSLAMAASLVACGGSNTTENKEPATENAGETTTEETGEVEDVTLTVWGPQEDQSDENGKWLQTNCEAFAAEHPEWNITFNYGVCAEGDAKTQLATDAAAGADVYLFANDQIPDLLNSNAIAELGGSTVEKIKANNSEVVVNTVTYQDGVYGVPFTGNTWFMYYNKSIFSEDDVKNLDTMLSKGKVAFPLSNSWYIAAFYAANGCTLFGENGTDEAAGIDFSGDKAVEVTNYLVDLVKNPNFVNDADGVGMAGLTDGSIGAIFSGSWDYGNVKEALGDNMGIIAPPTI
ncbi:MAG: extracellular solute-binding protein, partial [Acetatifactor sp.]|nr:extracellular solute-binding protein [Acetatifactor sp.]